MLQPVSHCRFELRLGTALTSANPRSMSTATWDPHMRAPSICGSQHVDISPRGMCSCGFDKGATQFRASILCATFALKAIETGGTRLEHPSSVRDVPFSPMLFVVLALHVVTIWFVSDSSDTCVLVPESPTRRS
jgi:hypothetical protein